MKVFAYCAYDWRRATRAAAGTKPLTCPPENTETIGTQLSKATEADILYLNLHGFENQPYLYGQQDETIGPTALTVDHINQHNWHNVVIFAEVCWSAKNGGSEIARAFLDNGAKAFIGSTTEAYGRIKPTLWDGEADRLMLLFRRFYGRIREPKKALSYAKRLLKIFSYPLDENDKKTLSSFICLEGEYEKRKI